MPVGQTDAATMLVVQSVTANGRRLIRSVTGCKIGAEDELRSRPARLGFCGMLHQSKLEDNCAGLSDKFIIRTGR